jgi:hypothetical protein
VAAPEEADALYGLPLEEFVAQRDALAKRLRGEGRREEAGAVKALAKPSVAAWAANQAVRARQGEARELWAAGDALAAAQSALLEGRGDPAALRDATRAEQAARQRLVDAARGLLTGMGRSLSPDVLERVGETLHAAALDPAQRESAAAGRLARELHYAGLGLGQGGPVPPPPAAGKAPGAGRGSKRAATAPPRTTRDRAGKAQRDRGAKARAAEERAERQRADEHRAERERAEAARQEQLAAARRAVRESEAAHARAELELAQAEREAARASQKLDAARKAQAEARRGAEAAAKEERRRGRALEQARDALERLD